MDSYRAKYGSGGPLSAGGASGLTPIPTNFPGQNFPSQTEIENYQRRLFYEFTTRELTDLDIIGERTLRVHDLNNDIIPLFRQSNWQRPNNPHYQGQFKRQVHQSPLGIITGHNVQVWRAMEPVLSLATMILNNAYMLPFDALLLGRRSNIHQSRIPPQTPGNAKSGAVWDSNDYYDGWPLQSFTKRPLASTPEHIAETQRERDATFQELNGRIRMRLKDSTEGTEGEMLDTNFAFTDRSRGKIIIYLNIKDVLLLLRTDLNDAEKFSTQWFLAETLVHETMHAIDFLRGYRRNHSPRIREPYYQNNIFTELGYDMSAAVFGGVGEPAVCKLRTDQPYFFFWLHTNYPNISWIEDRTLNPVLLYPNPSLEAIRYPIPINFFEHIFQTAFWQSGVRRLGIDILHADTIKHGAKLQFRRKGDQAKYAYGCGYDRVYDRRPDETRTWLSKTEKDARLDSIMNFNPAQRKAVLFGQSLSQYNELGGDYHNLAQVLDETIKKIDAHVANSPAVTPVPSGYVRTMVEYLENACDCHEDMVYKTLGMEQPNPPGNLLATANYPGDPVPGQVLVNPLPPDVRMSRNVFTDRRAGLLEWNRAIRGYIQGLYAQHNGHFPALGLRLESLRLVKLEHCRMRLFIPGENDAAYPAEAREMAQIDQAYLDAQDQAINRLQAISIVYMNFAAVSSAPAFTYFALMAVSGATPQAWGLSKAMRLRLVNGAIGPLREFRKKVDAAAWKTKAEKFHDLAVAARTRIMAEP